MKRSVVMKNKKMSLRKLMPAKIQYFYADIKASIDKLLQYRNLKRHFLKKMHYKPDIENPRSYNEKIIWKKLYDRNPLLPITADKYAVRIYLKNILGEEQAQKILIPLYQAVTKPEDIDYEALPDKFVAKPNHGSNMHLIVKSKPEISRQQLIAICKKWLKTNYGLFNYEWAYRKIPRKIIIEQLLESPDGELPHDYKFYCFTGKCKFFRVTRNRFRNIIRSGFYTPQWQQIDVNVGGYPIDTELKQPDCFHDMIRLAEKLSAPFDFVRVDLYEHQSLIYFGELTHYEASGLGRMEPQSFDFEAGKFWKLQRNYWLNNNSPSPFKLTH
jgi:hypothetical protein